MTAGPDRVLDRLWYRLAAVLFLKSALGWMTAWAFVWGSAVLVLRAAVGTPTSWLLIGLAGLPLVLVPAFLRARRRFPSPTALRALLDHQSGCGGLLMAGAERPLDGWQATLRPLASPSIRWRGGRSWALGGAAVLFVAVSFLIPQRLAALGGPPPLEIGREVEKLTKQLEVLKNEKLLDPARAEDLKQKLDQVRDRSSGTDPAKTLEALDHLSEIAQKTAREAAESAARKTEKLAAAESAAEALRKAGKHLDADHLSRAMAEMAGLVRKAAAEDEKLQKELNSGLKDGKDERLSPEDLKKLADALRDSKLELAEQLAKLLDAGLIDLESLAKCKACGECTADELAEFLMTCQGEDCDSLEALLCRCGKPGRGGLSRGPGPAALTKGDPSDPEGAKYKPIALPPSALSALKESKVTGISPGSPEKKPGEREAPGSGALDGAAEGGGSANTQIVLPRHRGAVERYFDRPAKPAK